MIPGPTTRKAIRQKVVQVIKDAATAAGSNVFGNRTAPLNQDKAPFILVYPQSEDITVIDKARGIERRDLAMIVEVVAEDITETQLNDALDDLAEEIETAIYGSDKLGNLVHDIGVESAEGEYSGQGDLPFGVWRITFQIAYVKRRI